MFGSILYSQPPCFAFWFWDLVIPFFPLREILLLFLFWLYILFSVWNLDLPDFLLLSRFMLIFLVIGKKIVLPFFFSSSSWGLLRYCILSLLKVWFTFYILKTKSMGLIAGGSIFKLCKAPYKNGLHCNVLSIVWMKDVAIWLLVFLAIKPWWSLPFFLSHFLFINHNISNLTWY